MSCRSKYLRTRERPVASLQLMPGSCKSVAGSTGGRNSAAGQPASIIPCSNALELSNNIIQKRLAFDRDWSGTVLTRARKVPRDPAPLASWPTRGFGGAARRRCQPRSQCQRLRRNHYMPRNFLLFPQSPRCRLLTIPRARKLTLGPSNLASSRCCSHPRVQRSPR